MFRVRFDNRGSRQGTGGDVALDIGTIAAAGERCIDKVVMVERTEYDDQIDCKHSYKQRCFTTYKTDYSPQQQEECEENFKKDCFIEFKPKASEVKVTDWLENKINDEWQKQFMPSFTDEHEHEG